MASDRPDLSLEEYRALRATIRQRGTARFVVTTITFVSWAGLLLAADSLSVIPVIGLIPLLVLAVGFEVGFAMHFGVERIGRYLQVRYETADALPSWEHSVMKAAAAKAPNPRIDALFAWPYGLATTLNLFVVLLMLGPSGEGADTSAVGAAPPLAFWIYALLHALLVGRIVSARRIARRQRDADLKLFS